MRLPVAGIRLFGYKVVVMNWAAYAETAQHLSEVRRREAQRRAQAAEQSAGLQEAVARLTARLAAQQAHQEETARGLRITVPPAVSDPAPPALDGPVPPALDEAVPPAPRGPLVPAPRRPETLGGAPPPAGSAPAGGATAPAGAAAAGASGTAGTSSAPNGAAPAAGSRPAGGAVPPAGKAVPRGGSAPADGSVAARAARAPAGAADPDETLRLAWEAVNRADVQTRLATERALKPLLLPEMKPAPRNALVYAAATLVAVVVQLGMVTVDSVAHLGIPTLLYLPALLFVLPALAFTAGYATLTVVGRPRIRATRPTSLSAKLGCLICFPGNWAALSLSMVVLALSGH
jgi:hypothetical protein